jgi:hypothetical protein
LWQNYDGLYFLYFKLIFYKALHIYFIVTLCRYFYLYFFCKSIYLIHLSLTYSIYLLFLSVQIYFYVMIEKCLSLDTIWNICYHYINKNIIVINIFCNLNFHLACGHFSISLYVLPDLHFILLRNSLIGECIRIYLNYSLLHSFLFSMNFEVATIFLPWKETL